MADQSDTRTPMSIDAYWAQVHRSWIASDVDYRWGQAAFNVLARVRPDLAEPLRGSPTLDPFYAPDRKSPRAVDGRGRPLRPHRGRHLRRQLLRRRPPRTRRRGVGRPPRRDGGTRGGGARRLTPGRTSRPRLLPRFRSSGGTRGRSPTPPGRNGGAGMAVSKRTRYEVLRRDDHRCRYCGRGAPDVPMTVDHVVPVTLGGSDKPENLVAACRDCNAGKSSVPPEAALVADVDQKAVDLARAVEAVAQRRMADYAAVRARVETFDRKWCTWTAGGRPVHRDGNWRNSITRFLSMGLSDEFLADAADTALGKQSVRSDRSWAYFCGICWRELDNIREAAMAETAPAAADPNRAVLPQGAGVDPSFDVLNRTDSFLADVLQAADIPVDIRQHAHRAYWTGMEEAYRVHMLGETPAGIDLDDWVCEQFSNGTAYDMHAFRLAVVAARNA